MDVAAISAAYTDGEIRPVCPAGRRVDFPAIG
jgi:hypothetical protein